MAYNPYYNSNPYFQQQPNFYGNGAMPDMLNQQKMQYQSQQNMQNIQQSTPIQQMTNHNNELLWVLNETEAVSFPVVPNNTVILWDKNQPTIYIKSANAQGVPSMRILDFEERSVNAPKTPTEHVCKCGDKFILKEDLNAVEDKIQEVMCRLSDVEERYKTLTAKPTTKTTKKTEDK